MKAFVSCTLIVASALMLLAARPSIHAWEKANGYPFGHMCNSVFTLYADTCVR